MPAPTLSDHRHEELTRMSPRHPTHRLSALLAVALVVALGLAACTRQEPEISVNEQVPAAARTEEEPADGGEENDGGGGEDSGDAVAIEAIDIDYVGVPDTVPAGDVTFALNNTGNLEHNIVIEELGDELVTEAQGGETAEGTVTLEPGTYTLYCSIPGHRSTMEEVVEAS
jgi:plastocyanin